MPMKKSHRVVHKDRPQKKVPHSVKYDSLDAYLILNALDNKRQVEAAYGKLMEKLKLDSGQEKECRCSIYLQHQRCAVRQGRDCFLGTDD